MVLLERTPPALEKREAHLPRWAFSMSHSCLPERAMRSGRIYAWGCKN
jgi:hypothetical protein